MLEAEIESMPSSSRRKWMWTAVLLLLVVIVGVLIVVLIGGSGSNGVTGPTAVPFTRSGSGSGYSPIFKVSGTWGIHWSYNCSSARDGEGNFVLNALPVGYESASSSSMSGTPLVNELGKGGSGTLHEPDAGTFVVSILSECQWTFAVASH